MIILREGAGLVVAHDVQTTIAAVDDALLTSARMCASVIEAMHGSNLPVAQSQQLLTAVTSGMASVLDGRAQMVEAIRRMHAIKGRSNLAPVDYGCPDGWRISLEEWKDTPAKRPAAVC